MGSIDESSWLQSVVTCADGYEARTVEQFTERLIRLAQTRLFNRCAVSDNPAIELPIATPASAKDLD